MQGAWVREEVAGRPVDVYEPTGARPRFGILHLHDLDLATLVDRPAFARLLDELRLACICPLGQRCWWADRICEAFDPVLTPERFLLEQVVPYANQRWKWGNRQIGLQGIGMGGQGALRLAFKHPETFPVVAALASALDYHELYGQGSALDQMYESKEQCRQDTAILHIHPSLYPRQIFFAVDPEDRRWYRGNDRLHEKLTALGVPHEVDLTTRAGGHTWVYYEQLANRVERFVAAGLEAESRRLL